MDTARKEPERVLAVASRLRTYVSFHYRALSKRYLSPPTERAHKRKPAARAGRRSDFAPARSSEAPGPNTTARPRASPADATRAWRAAATSAAYHCPDESIDVRPASIA